MLLNREKKKKRGGHYFRLALLIVILLILLVLLFGEQWGIGQGDLLRLVNVRESPAQNVEAPEEEMQEETAGYGEVKVRVVGNTIQVNETAYTLDGFEAYVDTLDENTLIVLMDEEANYTLFTTIEEMIDAKAVPYVIEE